MNVVVTLVLGTSTSVINRKQREIMRSIFVVSFMTSHTYKLGDKVFLQNNDGGPIGLEATGARTVMMLYDVIYKEKLKSDGIKMRDISTTLAKL